MGYLRSSCAFVAAICVRWCVMAEMGMARFKCECGKSPEDAMGIVMHAMLGHEIVMERFRNGRWRRSRETVADVILQQLQQRGESTEEFVRRIERAAEAMEAESERQAAVAAAEGITLGGANA